MNTLVLDVTAKTVATAEKPDTRDPVAAVRSQVQARIDAIEAQITPRRLREAVLTPEGAVWLAEREAEIAALREQLP
ncbi:MAG: hypothetical protein GX567_19715 [Clostridia bacterium]|nr:hypothetical protein [Clostridia bacterium]